MPRRPIPGVSHERPAFPALSQPMAGPRPTPTKILPPQPARPGDSGNVAQPGQPAREGGISLPDPPKPRGPRVFQKKGVLTGGF